jgi:hypothetical protein
MLTFEFGEAHLEIAAPRDRLFIISPRLEFTAPCRSASVTGEWHLWIYLCAWSIACGDRQLAHSESPDVRINRAVHFLNGQEIRRVEIDATDGRTLFEFDLGGILRTWPCDGADEQWMLFDPSGNVLTVRADGRFAYHSSDEPNTDAVWHALAAVLVGASPKAAE